MIQNSQNLNNYRICFYQQRVYEEDIAKEGEEEDAKKEEQEQAKVSWLEQEPYKKAALDLVLIDFLFENQICSVWTILNFFLKQFNFVWMSQKSRDQQEQEVIPRIAEALKHGISVLNDAFITLELKTEHGETFVL